MPQTRALQILELGDAEGHPFRGNQYTGGIGGDGDIKIGNVRWDNVTLGQQNVTGQGVAERLHLDWNNLKPEQRNVLEAMALEENKAEEHGEKFTATINGQKYNIDFDEKGVPADAKRTALQTITSLAQRYKPFIQEGNPDQEYHVRFGNTGEPNTTGLTYRGLGRMVIAGDLLDKYPTSYVAGDWGAMAGSWHPPSWGMRSELEATILHEWGHAYDDRGDRKAQNDYEMMGSPSFYGSSNRREQYAEAFADWHIYPDGATTASKEFAEKYGWKSLTAT